MAQRDLRGDALVRPEEAAGKEGGRTGTGNLSEWVEAPVAETTTSSAKRLEPTIQFISRAAGPLALIAALIGLYLLIF